MEILITIIIVILAVYIIFRNIKASSKGKCNCSDCNKSCSKRQNNINIDNKKN